MIILDLTEKDKYIKKLAEELTKINKDAEKEFNKIKKSDIYDVLTDEDGKVIYETLKDALKIIRVKNKLTYTPKKYRKNNKLFQSIMQ